MRTIADIVLLDAAAKRSCKAIRLSGSAPSDHRRLLKSAATILSLAKMVEGGLVGRAEGP